MKIPQKYTVALAMLTSLALLPSTMHAEIMPPDRQREVMRAALNAFDQAVAVAHQKPEDARRLYNQAAQGFQLLLSEEGGLRNAALEYNLANTYYRLGEIGQAILHYLRAERLDPARADVQKNLAYVRNRVDPFIEPAGQQRLLRRLLFWQYQTSARQRFLAAAILSATGWLLLILRLRFRLMPLVILGMLLVVLGAANCGLVLWQLHEEHTHPTAVVVGDQQVLRLGRGTGYDAALNEPLGPGVELRILETRGDWAKVRLRNNQQGWLQRTAIKRVATPQ